MDLEKREQLNVIKSNLKEKFFGIDEQIDRIIDSISAWYIAPEICTRPTIVNIWGITGTGKTSLVRELVRELGFNDRYLEMQMGSETLDSVEEVLQESNIEIGKPGIVLFDEFQRFRRVDEGGSEKTDLKNLDDIWMLLSDGKFPMNKSINLLKRMVMDIEFDEDKRLFLTRQVQNEPKKKKNNNYPPTDDDDAEENIISKHFRWDSPRSKKLFQYVLQIPIFELEHMENKKIKKIINDFLAAKIERVIDYTKLLIFVSGNIDEAYSSAFSVSDCDTDADVYYEYTKKVSIIDIKRSLLRRFKPEQVARLGNTHVLYPSLNRNSYEKLIVRNCGQYVKMIEDKSPVKIEIDPEVYDIIYDNSVYPMQGTRPVFSTIQTVFTSPLTRCVLWAMENGYKKINLSMTRNPSKVIAYKGKNKFELDIVLDIENQKDKYSSDYTTLIAVHEAGHALVHALIYQEPPKELKINVASFEGGYNSFDHKVKTLDSYIDFAKVCLAGTAAEDVVFGNRSVGCSADIAQATQAVAFYHRVYGGDIKQLGKKSQECDSSCVWDLSTTDGKIESILENSYKETKRLIEVNHEYLIDMTDYLIENKSMSKEMFIERYGEVLGLATDLPKDVYSKYRNKYNQYKYLQYKDTNL